MIASPMSDLLTRLHQDLTASRKAQDKPATLVLGTTIAEARNREIETRRPLTDDDVVDVLRKAIKRRREAADMYQTVGRTDLAEKERGEGALLERYLPAQVDEGELRAAVRAAIDAGAANVGAVMGKVMPQFKGRADGSVINAIARDELAKRG
jgi:uncharacterized protein YqeY